MKLSAFTVSFITVLAALLCTLATSRPHRKADKHVRLSGLDSFPNGSYEMVEIMELRNIPINEPSADYFTSRSLYNLEKLYATFCHIGTIQENAFRNMTKLKLLDLSQNKLTSLYNYSFAGLPRLEHLDLSANKLKLVHKEVFSHLSSLQRLVLSNNVIIILDIELLEGTAVTRLNLKNNTLILNQSGPILKSKILLHLNLQSCSIQNLSWNAFSLLPQLEDLDLSKNPLKVLPADLPKHTPRLQHLNMDCFLIDNNDEVLCFLTTLKELPCENYRLKTEWDCRTIVLSHTEADDNIDGFKRENHSETQNLHTIPKEIEYGHTSTASTQHIQENDLSSDNNIGEANNVKSQRPLNIGQNQTENDVLSPNNDNITDGTARGQKQLSGNLRIALRVGIIIIILCLEVPIALFCYSHFQQRRDMPATISEQFAFVH